MRSSHIVIVWSYISDLASTRNKFGLWLQLKRLQGLYSMLSRFVYSNLRSFSTKNLCHSLLLSMIAFLLAIQLIHTEESYGFPFRTINFVYWFLYILDLKVYYSLLGITMGIHGLPLLLSVWFWVISIWSKKRMDMSTIYFN